MVRIGVVGFGNRISGVINGIMRPLEPELRVIGVVDPDREGARSRMAESGDRKSGNCQRSREPGSLASEVKT